MPDEVLNRIRARDRSRSARKRTVRARTVNLLRVSKRDLDLVRDEATAPPPSISRPRTRGECIDGPRPCPWVSCRHHLYLDVGKNAGRLKFNFPDLEPGELAESCALDVADRGGETLERVAERMNLTRERVRQIESRALAKVGPLLEKLDDKVRLRVVS